MSARVLVVDDDPTVAEVVGDYLRRAGMEPRVAADGHTALRLAGTWRPDLVVLDVMLPGIDGLEVCRRLRDARGEQALLRRGAAPGAGPAAASPPLRSGRIEVDVASRRARRDGRELSLTVREFDLLAFFMSHPGQAFTRAELMKRVWGWSFGDQSTVTVHVRRLRDKVEAEPASPVLLRTVRGIGYCWDAEPSPEGPGADISN